MKYYTINWEDDLNVIGHYPQTSFKKGYNPTIDGVYNVCRNSFPNFVPNIDFKLHKKAKRTSFLESAAISFGMIINSKFKDVLKKFNLPPHAFYPIKVYHKGELLDYYWFHYIVRDFWDWLDKNKSKAVITDNKKGFQAVAEIDLSLKLANIKELDDSLPYYQNMKWEKIIFKPDFPKYDVYETQTMQYRTLISRSLLNALQEEGMTGFTAKPYDVIETV